MVCPRCSVNYDRKASERCPGCGDAVAAATAGVLKTSTILISTGVDRCAGVYRSVEDVPQPLRKRLEQSTSGLNCGTIFIADQRGRQEISSAIRALRSKEAGERRWNSPSALAFAALLASFAAAVSWLVYAHTW